MSESARRGRLVVIEGIDQSGKQTQVEALRARLAAAGITSRAFDFPAYDTPVGQLIGRYLAREIELTPEARQLLYVANRWELAPAIAAALAAGDFVIVDRYSASGIVYGAAQGLDPAWLETLERGLPQPDHTILLDLPPEAAFVRKQRARDRYEAQFDLLTRCRALYRARAARDGWLTLDATQPIETIAAAIWARVGPLPLPPPL